MEDIRNNVITIVGPSGSGKSTIGYIVAVRLNFRYLDVGKLWRIIGAKLLQDGHSPDDERACLEVAKLMREAARSMSTVAGPDTFIADRIVELMGVSPGQLTQRGVGQLTSRSTAHLSVREAVAETVRALYWDGGTVAVGRPFLYQEALPDAFLIVLLYAKEQLRAVLNQDGEAKAEILKRDKLDGIDTISMEDLAEVHAAYNTGIWSTVDLAQAIATLAWRRSPIMMTAQLNAL